MKVITTMEELMEMIENTNGYCGLRGASEHDIEIVGRGYLDCSYDLFDRRDCDFDEDCEQLKGTCGIGVTPYMGEDEILEMYENAKGYAVNHHGTDVVYLISDSSCEYGEDESEVILGHNGYGADVLAEVRL